MTASFITANRSSRSLVSKRNAIKVISFSGSLSSSWTMSDLWWKTDRLCTHITLKQRPNLRLYALAFSEQTLIDAEILHAASTGANVIDMGVTIGLRALHKIVGIAPDVLALCLNCNIAKSQRVSVVKLLGRRLIKPLRASDTVRGAMFSCFGPLPCTQHISTYHR